jgi:hypothetical protein
VRHSVAAARPAARGMRPRGSGDMPMHAPPAPSGDVLPRCMRSTSACDPHSGLMALVSRLPPAQAHFLALQHTFSLCSTPTRAFPGQLRWSLQPGARGAAHLRRDLAALAALDEHLWGCAG